MENNYPLKHLRLDQLFNAGFNIADFICAPPKQLDPVLLKEIFNRYKDKHGISLRHFHEDENRYFKCPVKYEVKDWDTALRFCQEHNVNFYTLVNEAIPLQDATYGGNIWLLDDRDFAMEYFEGPGSPRDTENKKLQYFKRSVGEPFPKDAPPELLKLAGLFKGFINDAGMSPIVIEFNIYPYPVGKRQEKAIIWEWRKGLLHETSEIIENLLTEIETLKFRNSYLEELLIKKDALVKTV